MTEKHDRRVLVLFLPALAGMLAVYISTLKGPGIGGDATIYVESAKNLLDGTGLGLVGPSGEFRLLPYFAPFFSLVLAFFGLLGFDLVSTAQWLNILLYGGLIWMVAYFSYRTSHMLWLSLLAALLVAVSPVLIPVYSWAMSEPLSIFLGFAGLWFVLPELSGAERNWKWFVGGLVTGLSFLTRYGSAAFLWAWTIFVLLRSAGSFPKRLANAVKFGVTGSLPMLVWVIYDLTHTATVGSRSLESAAGITGRLLSFWPALEEVILFWFIPESWSGSPPYPSFLNHVIAAGFCVFAVGSLILLIRKIVCLPEGKAHGLYDLILALAGFSLVYGLVMFGVYLFTYPPITIGSRMFSPAHIAVIWSLGLAITLLAGSIKRKSTNRWLPVVLMLLLVGWYGLRSIRIVAQNYELGLGYHSSAWQQSETMEAVRQLPDDTQIVTNEETAVLFLIGKPSLAFQEIFQDHPLDRFTRYGDGALPLDEAQEAFRQDGAAFVLFNSVFEQLEGIYGAQTEQRVESLTEGLQKAFQGEDGAIYYYPEE